MTEAPPPTISGRLPRDSPFAEALALGLGAASVGSALALGWQGLPLLLPLLGGSLALWLAASLGRLRGPLRGLLGAPPLSLVPLALVLLCYGYSVLTISIIHSRAPVLDGGPKVFAPGLYTDLTPLLVALQLAAAAAIGLLYRPEHRARAVALVAMLFSGVLYATLFRYDFVEATVSPVGTPLLWATLLLALPGLRWSHPERADPLGAPVVALLAAGGLATALSSYVFNSLANLLTLAGFSALGWLISRLEWDRRSLALAAAALMVPPMGMALVELVRLAEFARVMGVSFLGTLAFEFQGVALRNNLGLDLALALVLATGMLTAAGTVRARLLWAVPALVAAAALFFTYSLPGVLAAVVGLAAVAVLNRPTFWRLAWLRRHLAQVAALALMLAALGFAARPALANFSYIITDPNTGPANRLFVWGLVVRDVAASPVVGLGLGVTDDRTQHVGDFPYREATRQLEERSLMVGLPPNAWRELVYTHPHNLFLGFLEGGGILALLAFLAVLGAGVAAVGGRLRDPAWRRAAAPFGGALLGLLAWGVGSLGEHPLPAPPVLWVLLGLTVGVAAPGPATRKGWPRRLPVLAPWVRRWGRVLAPLLALAIFLGLVARPIAAQALTQRGNERSADEAYASAAPLYEAAHRLEPLDSQPLRRWAEAELQQGHLAGAADLFRRTAEVRSAQVSDRARYGLAAWLVGDLQAAEESLAQAVAMDPWAASGSQPQLLLALFAARAGRYPEAQMLLETALLRDAFVARDIAWVPVSTAGELDWGLDPAYRPEAPQEALAPRLELRLGLHPFNTLRFPPVALEPPLRFTEVLAGVEALQAQLEAAGDGRADDVLLQMSMVADLAGLFDGARGYADRLVALAPEDSVGWFQVGQVANDQGDVDAALAAYERSRQIADASARYDLRLPLSQLRLGYVLLEQRRWSEAAQRFEAAQEDNRFGYIFDLLAAKGEGEMRTGLLPEAEESLRQELLFYDRPSVRLLLAEVQAARGELDEAEENVIRALQGWVRVPLARGVDLDQGALELVELHRRLGLAPEEGLRRVDSALDDDDQPERAAQARAAYRQAAGDLQGAIQILEQAVADSDDPSELLVTLARAYLAAGRDEEALGTALRVPADDDFFYGAQLLAATAAAGAGDPARAEVILWGTLESFPAGSEAYLQLADLAQSREDGSGALELYRRARAAAPRDASVHRALGDALVRAGLLSEALEEYGVAAALKPGDPANREALLTLEFLLSGDSP